ncbi:hypothetical protein BDW02DRAFT_572394 [Decorospora gaudefroyi]|uniref:Uncharacterized protein n=1 Tax=Decorospora gaudefroyi TaxID=184978 RepID=A0A6A5K4M5_9PLEO|nr:hypothetical protein BDW02DRAFT_572394 [Decorospora gaudefroyi]
MIDAPPVFGRGKAALPLLAFYRGTSRQCRSNWLSYFLVEELPDDVRVGITQPPPPSQAFPLRGLESLCRSFQNHVYRAYQAGVGRPKRSKVVTVGPSRTNGCRNVRDLGSCSRLVPQRSLSKRKYKEP